MSDIINIDDLYGNQREIAEVIGIDNYIKLSKYFVLYSDITLLKNKILYIYKKYSELVKISRNNEIRKLRKKGYSASKLAKMYNLSTRYIRMICKLKEDF